LNQSGSTTLLRTTVLSIYLYLEVDGRSDSGLGSLLLLLESLRVNAMLIYINNKEKQYGMLRNAFPTFWAPSLRRKNWCSVPQSPSFVLGFPCSYLENEVIWAPTVPSSK
jgi:hypothetical protein